MTNAYYEIEIDHETQLPTSIRMTVLTGRRGSTITKGKKIVGGEHVAFHFNYALSDFGAEKAPSIPPEANRILTKR